MALNDGEVQWGEPPPLRRGARSSHSVIAKTLKTNPKEWASILVYGKARTAATVARIIRQGETQAWQPQGAFEAVARTVDGEHRIYARYVGDV